MWNVNYFVSFRKAPSLLLFYINYVECKCVVTRIKRIFICCFILTMWNVNSDEYALYKKYNLCFILTMWNVNTGTITAKFDVKAGFILTMWNVNAQKPLALQTKCLVLY